MALLFLDSFDHYATADLSDKYFSGGGSIVTAGRHGSGRGLTGGCRLALTPGSARLILGAAYKFTITFNTVYTVYDYTNTVCSVWTTNNGGWSVQTNGGPTITSASDVWRTNQWHYIEVDLTITATGTPTYSLTSARVLVDGTVVLNSAVGASIAGTGPASTFFWSHVDITPNAAGTMDDFYVLDGSGAAPHNAPLGDIQIDVIRPNGVGASTQWTPTGAATNWGAVKDLVPDDETTKVIAATAGLSDLYAMEDVNTNNGIIGAQLLINARRTEEGFATLTPLLRHAGVTTELVSQLISPTYFYRNRDCFVKMPNGDPLTDVNLNALQAGIKRSA